MKLLEEISAYVAGAFLPGSAETFAVVDPATNETLAQVPRYDSEQTSRAVEAARLALETPTAGSERGRWLISIAEAHGRHRDELAELITHENGKPLAEARAEVDYAAGFYREAATLIGHLATRVLPSQPKNHRWRIVPRPAGVAGIITPWNFPLAMLAKKVAATLAAGAPIVVKPSEKTPLSAIALFRILHGLDLPTGMVNLVFGDPPSIGRIFCEHPAVRVVSFTGSTRVGKILAQQAAPHIKRMALELGGNAPFIVFDDADLDKTLDHLMANKFRCSGQTCVCANRVYVQAGTVRRFIERVAERVAALKVGPGLEPDVQIGPLIDEDGYRKVTELVGEALEGGAKLVVGGRPEPGSGLFYPPTVLEGVTASMRCVHEEVFGPVIPVISFDTEDEVVRAANATQYGLAAYVFTGDAARLSRMARRLRFGHLGLNTATGPTPEAPFGGMKQSGLGREGGLEGLMEYVELQVMADPASGFGPAGSVR